MTDKTDIAALREALLVSMEFVEAEAKTGGKADLQMWLDVVYPAFTAKIVNELMELRDQLEAERQQRGAAEEERDRIDGRNAELNSTLERWSVERAENANEIEELRAALRGEQEPVAVLHKVKHWREAPCNGVDWAKGWKEGCNACIKKVEAAGIVVKGGENPQCEKCGGRGAYHCPQMRGTVECECGIVVKDGE